MSFNQQKFYFQLSPVYLFKFNPILLFELLLFYPQRLGPAMCALPGPVQWYVGDLTVFRIKLWTYVGQLCILAFWTVSLAPLAFTFGVLFWLFYFVYMWARDQLYLFADRYQLCQHSFIEESILSPFNGLVFLPKITCQRCTSLFLYLCHVWPLKSLFL